MCVRNKGRGYLEIPVWWKGKNIPQKWLMWCSGTQKIEWSCHDAIWYQFIPASIRQAQWRSSHDCVSTSPTLSEKRRKKYYICCSVRCWLLSVQCFFYYLFYLFWRSMILERPLNNSSAHTITIYCRYYYYYYWHVPKLHFFPFLFFF